MLVELIYGVRVDKAGCVPPLFQSQWNAPSFIAKEGYLHRYGVTESDAGTYIGVEIFRLGSDHAVVDAPLDRLHTATHHQEDAMRQFDQWLTMPAQAVVRSALGDRQAQLMLVASEE